ncbi:MAG TPA: hypothetical protein VH062_14750 [Polyangiaceae bacterium]|jgi:hypothetical protein|nr:hypothetical protein [Polyangiaceae bacterium]
MIDEKKLQVLLLCRLSFPTKKASSISEVSRRLFPFVDSLVSAREWRTLLERTIGAARDAGLVDTKQLRITVKGQKEVRHVLGSAPPVKDWRAFKQQRLLRLVTDGAAPNGSRAAAMLLGQALGVSPAPKETAVVDEWLTRKLGLRGKQVTLGGLRAALVAKELGVPVRQSLVEVVRLAVARQADAPSGSEEHLLNAMVARYVSRVPAPGKGAKRGLETKTRASAGTSKGNGASTADLREPADFASRVLAVAHGSAVRRFGPTKTFIGSVWAALRSDRDMDRIGETRFKQLLADAHRRGLLTLSRADLVTAMDPDDVNASEVNHLGATYHFINVGGEKP